MTKFTKDRLIELARENVRVLKLASRQHPGQPVIAMDLRLAEIALAALTGGMEQEPAYFINKVTYSDVYGNDVELRAYDCEVDAIKSKADFGGVVIPVYAAPQLPLPAAPEDFICMLTGRAKYLRDHGEVKSPELLERAAAMLQGAEPVSQTYTLRDGWVAVPVEPTEEILDEFDSIIDYGAEDSKDAWSRLLAAAWIKSLPAAPQQEADNG